MIHRPGRVLRIFVPSETERIAVIDAEAKLGLTVVMAVGTVRESGVIQPIVTGYLRRIVSVSVLEGPIVVPTQRGVFTSPSDRCNNTDPSTVSRHVRWTRIASSLVDVST